MGLAGFAGVVVVLGRGPGRWEAADSLRIRMLLGAAFGALFSSLVPIGLAWTGVSEAASVRIGSAVLLVVQAALFVQAREISRLPEEQRALFSAPVARVILVLWISIMAAVAAAAAGVAGRATAGLFFLGLAFLLAYAAFGFYRLMFVRPASEGTRS